MSYHGDYWGGSSSYRGKAVKIFPSTASWASFAARTTLSVLSEVWGLDDWKFPFARLELQQELSQSGLSFALPY
jgi:hypothetical protein